MNRVGADVVLGLSTVQCRAFRKQADASLGCVVCESVQSEKSLERRKGEDPQAAVKGSEMMPSIELRLMILLLSLALFSFIERMPHLVPRKVPVLSASR